MVNYQNGILQQVPRAARYQFFRLKPGADPRQCLSALAEVAVAHDVVVGLGSSLLRALDVEIPGMKQMPSFDGVGVEVPVTPCALWCWIRGDDRGDLLHKARQMRSAVCEAFELDRVVDAFQYSESRDLTGFEDGTENPEGEDAVAAAFVGDEQAALAGSSFVAVQQWVHDLDAFQALSRTAQNHAIGRDLDSNEELDEAPDSAHVKRTEQEGFEPEAFVLRRSMPWASDTQEGLMFVAFGHSFRAFEVQMQRMVGADDGVIDGLFQFTRPVTGSYFWCPPVKAGMLDLSPVLNT